MKILLVSPETPATFWSFKHVLAFVSKKASFPPLGLLTVAAMLPRDWRMKVVDLNVRRLRDSEILDADYVLLGAMIAQKDSAREVARRCALLGRPVLAGGPLFTTGHEDFPEIPHFALGEAEDLMPRIVADLEAGRLQPIYRSEQFPCVERTPLPRWDLIRARDYVTLAAQFSRGCPFDCEFCDIVIMNGRRPRTKPTDRFIEELEVLRRLGWKDMVFVVDDNFIGNKVQARALLHAMIEWRRSARPEMGFFTQASINLADDPELRALMVEAGFRKVFIGIETPSPAGLEESHKVQNRGRDLVEAVRIIQEAGLEVMGGFIVGFDSDKRDIFRQQFEFIQRSGVVTAMVGLLNALPQTRLYQRLKTEGRLLAESTGNNTMAALNFRPVLNREFLENGYRELMRRLYEPRSYYQRIRTFLGQHQPARERLRLSLPDLKAFLRSFWVLGIWHRGRVGYWRLFFGTLLRHPRQFRIAIELAIIGHHFRRVAAKL